MGWGVMVMSVISHAREGSGSLSVPPFDDAAAAVDGYMSPSLFPHLSDPSLGSFFSPAGFSEALSLVIQEMCHLLRHHTSHRFFCINNDVTS